MQLVLKGYTGEGFLSEGKRLGGKKVPSHEARRLARAAAEKRRTLTAGSGQRLGGAPVMRGTDIRKTIADAAQKRIDVTKGCASGTDRGRNIAKDVSNNGFRTKAEEDDANEEAIIQAFIDLIREEEKEQLGNAYIPPSSTNPAGPRSMPSPPVPQHTKPNVGNDPIIIPDEVESPDQSWTCPICTLDNPETFLCCDACASERPLPKQMTEEPKKPPKRTQSSQSSKTNDSRKPPSSSIQRLAELDRNISKKPLGWICHSCGTFMEPKWWTCSACGTMKLTS